MFLNESTYGSLTFSWNCLTRKILVIQLKPEMLLANQSWIVEFSLIQFNLV